MGLEFSTALDVGRLERIAEKDRITAFTETEAGGHFAVHHTLCDLVQQSK